MGWLDVVSGVVKKVEEYTGVDLPGGYTKEELQRIKAEKQAKKSQGKSAAAAKAANTASKETDAQVQALIEQATKAANAAAIASQMVRAAGEDPEKLLKRRPPTRPKEPPSDVHAPLAHPDLSPAQKPGLVSSSHSRDTTPTIELPPDAAAKQAKVAAAQAQQTVEEAKRVSAVQRMYASGAEQMAKNVNSLVQEYNEYVKTANKLAKKLDRIVEDYEAGRITYEQAKKQYESLKPLYDLYVHKTEFTYQLIQQSAQKYEEFAKEAQLLSNKLEDLQQKYNQAQQKYNIFVQGIQEYNRVHLEGASLPEPDYSDQDLNHPSKYLTKEAKRTVNQVSEIIDKVLVEPAKSAAERAMQMPELKATLVGPTVGYVGVAAASAVKGAITETMEMVSAVASAPVAVGEFLLTGNPSAITKSYAWYYASRTVKGLGEFTYRAVTDPIGTVKTIAKPEVFGEIVGRGFVWGKVTSSLSGSRVSTDIDPLLGRQRVSNVTKAAASQVDDVGVAAFMRREFAPKQPRSDLLFTYARKYREPTLIPSGGYRLTRSVPKTPEAVVSPQDIYKAAKQLGVKGKTLKYLKSLARKKANLSSADLARVFDMLPADLASKVARRASELAKDRAFTRSEFFAATPLDTITIVTTRKVVKAIDRLRAPKIRTDVTRYINRKFYNVESRVKQYYPEPPKEFYLPKQRAPKSLLLDTSMTQRYTLPGWLSRVAPAFKVAPIAAGKVLYGMDVSQSESLKIVQMPKQVPKLGVKLAELQILAVPELTVTTTKTRINKPRAKLPKPQTSSTTVSASAVDVLLAPPKLSAPVIPTPRISTFKAPPKNTDLIDRKVMKPKRRAARPVGFGYREIEHRIGDIFGVLKRGKKRTPRGIRKSGKYKSPLTIL